jgi:hypothetical protein
MKTNLLLNDETRPAELMLQNIAPTKAMLRETETVAGCNCDRWGHPCPRWEERKVQPKAEPPISSGNQTT